MLGAHGEADTANHQHHEGHQQANKQIHCAGWWEVGQSLNTLLTVMEREALARYQLDSFRGSAGCGVKHETSEHMHCTEYTPSTPGTYS